MSCHLLGLLANVCYAQLTVFKYLVGLQDVRVGYEIPFHLLSASPSRRRRELYGRVHQPDLGALAARLANPFRAALQAHEVRSAVQRSVTQHAVSREVQAVDALYAVLRFSHQSS